MTVRALRRGWDLLLLGTIALVYLGVFPYFPAVNNPNEGVRFYMTAAIVEEHRFEIDTFRKRWGHTNDAAIYEGRPYSVKAPATSYLGVPGYAAYYYYTKYAKKPLDRATALWFTRVTGTVLPSLIFYYAFLVWLRRRVRRRAIADATVIALALGSPMLGYGNMFVSHTTCAAAAFGALMLLGNRTPSARRGWAMPFWAGLLAGGTTLLEYPGAVVSVVLGVYALLTLRSWRARFSFGLGAGIPALLLMHFQWRAFGNPLRPGHIYVEDASFRAAHHQGFYGADGFRWDAIGSLLGNPGFGLFTLTPLLVFAVPGIFILLRRRQTRGPALVVFMASLLTIAIIGTMNNWRGGWTIGPRYLLTIYPFFAWPAAVALDRWSRRFPVLAPATAIGLTLASILLAGLPSLYFPHLPENVARPFSQLVMPLFEYNFAPPNLLNLFNVWGRASIIPFFALMGLCVLIVLWQTWSRMRDKSAGLLAAAIVCGGVLALNYLPVTAGSAGALGYASKWWSPEGHDYIGGVQRRLHDRAATPEECEEMAVLLDSWERQTEARMTHTLCERLSRQNRR